MDLQKQVKYKPRQKHQLVPTKHGKNRSYKALCALGDDVYGSVCEMDTVIGRKYDEKCLLTLYLRCCKFQIVLLLKRKSCEEVCKMLNALEILLGVDDFRKLFGYILTDNGIEFADYHLLEKSQESKNKKDKRCSIFYCDVRASNQKGGCEKNHVEIRKIIPKRNGIIFDRLVAKDIVYINSQINSTPRKSLGGKTPIEMFRFFFKDVAENVLAFLGIKELKTSELNLTLNGINNDRKKRGLEKLNE